MTDIEIKPTTFARGVPKAQHNGFYGIEEKLLGMPIGTQVQAVVTYEVKDDITKRGEGVRYPVIGVEHIEPLFDAERAEASLELQRAEYKERTGSDQLDLDFDTALDEDGAEAEGEDA